MPTAVPATAVPATAVPTPACPTAETYVVVPGDTLWSISERYGVTVGDLLAANPRVTDPRALRVGARLVMTPLTDLGTLGGGSAYATDINDRGQVVGASLTAAGDEHPFLWQDGVMTDLGGTAPPGEWMVARPPLISERGQVLVVWLQLPGQDVMRSVVWQDGDVDELGTLGGAWTEAIAINDLGQVVGTANAGTGYPQAFLWQDGTLVGLGDLGSGAVPPRSTIAGRRSAPVRSSPGGTRPPSGRTER